METLPEGEKTMSDNLEVKVETKPMSVRLAEVQEELQVEMRLGYDVKKDLLHKIDDIISEAQEAFIDLESENYEMGDDIGSELEKLARKIRSKHGN